MTDAAAGYQGYTNRETWAFCLHYANDYWLYTVTLDTAREHLRTSPDASDRDLGQHLIDHWREQMPTDHYTATRTSETLIQMNREVGSWWRVDATEVGASVRESLSVEA